MKTAISIMIIVILAAHSSYALCIGDEDFRRTGRFRVLRVTPNPSTGLWGSLRLGRWEVLDGCVLRLQNYQIYEDHEMQDSNIDVYTKGPACASKGGEIIDATISKTCCDTGWSTGGVESNACVLGTRHLVELRVRNAAGTKMRIHPDSRESRSAQEIDITDYESDWRTRNSAVKSHDQNLCSQIKDSQLKGDCQYTARIAK